MAARGWVDTLSEDWISQPRSSSPSIAPLLTSRYGTVNSVPTGTTRAHHSHTSNNSTTNRNPRRNATDTLGGLSNFNGTMQMHNKELKDTPEWKRKLMDDFSVSGGKDLFSPMRLESLFHPPTIGPNTSSPVLPPPKPQPLSHVKIQKKSYIPIPRSSPLPSALSMLPEKLTATKPSLSQRQENSQPCHSPRRQTFLSHRRARSSPKGLKGKRKIEKQDDTEHDATRKLVPPRDMLAKSEQQRVPRDTNLDARWLKSHTKSPSEEHRINDHTSPVSCGSLSKKFNALAKPTPKLLPRACNLGSSILTLNAPQFPQDEKEPVKALRSEIDLKCSKLYPPEDGESSVYPSSPPVPQSEESCIHEDHDNQPPKDSRVSLDSPFMSPRKPSQTPRSREKISAVRRLKHHSNKLEGSTLLKNIRGHKDAPRSLMKVSEVRKILPSENMISSDGLDDPFFTPHPFRYLSVPGSTTPQTPPPSESLIPKSKSSGSPLKLFSGMYDTYTSEKLRKRLGELEESVEQEQPQPNRMISFDSNADDASPDGKDCTFASIVVDRLEAMARQTEKENSPSKTKYVRRQIRKIQIGETVQEKITTTTTTTRFVNSPPHRFLSAPPSPEHWSPPKSVRKHRRWRSDESVIFPNDGVLGPSSPVKERSPKRVRRSTCLASPRPSPSGESIGDTRRQRVNSGIQEGSILASSRRQKSRAGSMESRADANDIVRAGSPTPPPRKKKTHLVVNPGGLTPIPALGKVDGPRRIVFSGCKGDGMQGQNFKMPTPSKKSDGPVRKGSVTTQDFLQQAEEVMERIRKTSHHANVHDYEPESPEFSFWMGDNEINISDDKCPLTSSPDDAKERSASRAEESVLTNMNDELQESGDTTAPGDRTEDNQALTESQMSRPSRTLVRVISNQPGLLSHHIATKTLNDMTFDKKTMIWVSTTLGGQSYDDPFHEVSDLLVDYKEEERALTLARSQWGVLGSTPDGVEKSGLWRSSRVIDDTEMRELREGDNGVGPDRWGKPHWNVSQELSSSLGSGSSGQSTEGCFGTASGTVTRTTSFGTEVENDKEKENATGTVQDAIEAHAGDTVQETDIDKSKPIARFADSVLSPFGKGGEILDDSNVDGFLEHGSLRQLGRSNSSFGSLYRGTSRRKSSGKTMFLGRPVSRITEEEEGLSNKTRHPNLDFERDLHRLSLNSVMTPIQTPFKRSLSIPPSSKKKTDVSFYLSPLPDLSYRFEATEALVSLELSYITSRRGETASSKAVEASFSIAQENLVKHLTDVEPYDPYWDFIKCLKLAQRKLETLHTLNDWCPRVAELDASDNELGQLSGVPESVLNLNIQRNCLSNATFFGHLANLQYLDLSGNGLECLDALRTCRHLREIKADDNQLTSIEGVFEIAGLMSLRCRRNRLERVHLKGSDLKRLIELDLRGNQLVEITGLELLSSLIHLNLDQNQLNTLCIPSKTKLESIRSIKLTQNNFSVFNVRPFPNLRILYMDNNKLSNISGFTTAKSLDAVSFRDQSTFSGVFDLPISRMFEARKIYLSSNPIGQRLSFTTSFLNLQFLEIAGCQLRKLPKGLAQLIPNVRVINLNYNSLSDLQQLGGLSRLVKLSCVGNRLASLKKLRATLERCGKNIKHVDFRDNPLTLGFYPPPLVPVVSSFAKVDNASMAEEYPNDPFELPPASQDIDCAHWGRMDLVARCERRRYLLALAQPCLKVKGVDGLVVDRNEILGSEDEVWQEMVKNGMVVLDDDEGGEGVIPSQFRRNEERVVNNIVEE